MFPPRQEKLHPAIQKDKLHLNQLDFNEYIIDIDK